MVCPTCKTKGTLKPEFYEGVEIDRCGKCNGVWLDDGELVKILNAQEKSFSEELIKEALKSAFTGVSQEEKESVENCPRCHTAMAAMNYNYSSGVIIDRCMKSHGIWLNSNELEKVQIHKEHWDKQEYKNKNSWVQMVKASGKDKEKHRSGSGRHIIDSVVKILFDL